MTTIYWLVQTEAETPTNDDWLAAGELAHLTRLLLAKRRADWRLGRWTAKCAIAAYLRMGEWESGNRGKQAPHRPLAHSPTRPPAVEIRAAADGAPEAFLDGQSLALTISISHCTDRALCAVTPADAALGCDLEVIEPRSEAFIADYFTPEERALVKRAPQADRSRLATLIWSAKESALKALRTGLRLDTRCVVVSLPPSQPFDGWSRLAVQAADTGQTFQGWWRQDGIYLLTVVATPPPSPPMALISSEAGFSL